MATHHFPLLILYGWFLVSFAFFQSLYHWLCRAQKLLRKYSSSRFRRRSPMHTCVWISCTLLSHIMSCFKEVHKSWISSWCHFSTLLLVSRQGHSLGGFMIQLLLIILTLNCSQQLTYVIKEDFKVKHLIHPGLGCLTSTWWQCGCCFCESHWQT